MQDCFRRYPEVYGAELEDDEVEGDAPVPEQAPPAAEIDASSSPDEKRARAKEANAQVKANTIEKGEHAEAEALVPKAAHDAANKN